MNKNYLFAAAIMACVCTSCSQDESLNVVGGESLVFTGEMESVGSRTSLSEDNKVLWTENDEVSVFKGTNTNRLYKVVSVENGKATFDFVSYIPTTETIAFSGNYSVYPYSDSNAIDANGTISAKVGAEYTYTDKASSISSALMVAKSEDTNFSYKNAQGILRLRLNAEIPEDFSKIVSITLTSASQNLSGVAEMSWEGTETPVAVIKDDENASKSLTINIPDGLVLPAKQDNGYVEVYVPVVPVTFGVGDVEMTFVFEDGTKLTSRKNASEFSIVRKEITGMKYTIGTDEFTGEIEGVVFTVGSDDELGDALNKYAAVNIAAEKDYGTNAITINNNDVVMNMNDNKVTAGGDGTNNYAFHLSGSNVEVNDANINGAGFAVMQESSVTVNSGTIAAKPGKSGRNMFYVIGNSSVTVNEGTYTFDRTSCYFVYVEAGSTCYINGGHFEKPLANNASKDSFVNSASAGTVIITGGTFNMDPTAWLADGYKAVKNGEIWTVVSAE